jgi:hypothetical protein
MANSSLAEARTVDLFDGVRMKLEDIIASLSADGARRLTADGLEGLIAEDGRELLRQLLQSALTKRAQEEERLESVVGEDGVERTHVRSGTQRSLTTTFGRVSVERLAYSARGENARMPLDAELSLPENSYSFKVRRRIAEYSSEMSFEKTRRFTDTFGARIPQRQTEELAARAARDFESFYASLPKTTTTSSDFVVLSFDGKGIAMRKEGLREATRKAAEARQPRLDKRRSKGEPAHRKRMAEVGAVYDVAPFARTPKDLVTELREKSDKPKAPRPRARNKWLRASVEREMLDVIIEGFREAHRRDSDKSRRWVVLVDGNEDQLAHIAYCAKEMNVEVTIVLDVIHVLEYLWRAGLSFNDEASPELQDWVGERLLRVLEGHARDVAAGIRRSATKRGLTASERKNADACARYLLKYQQHLRYDEYLRDGLPIATGVIEGACRSVVADRMDITGARWGVKGAEAILKLRTLRMSDDFDAYWDFHVAEEHRLVHESKYPPGQAPGPKTGKTRGLRLIKGASK